MSHHTLFGFHPWKIFFVCILLMSTSLAAQNRNLSFFLTLEGLPTDEVEKLYQDKEGYMWIATKNGLCRYDGYQLKVYKSNLYNPELLYDNRINCITEDGNHKIWIGTANGLVILDKRTGIFKKVIPGKLLNNNIQAILATKANEVWIGTAGGLHRYTASKDSFFYYTERSTNYRLLGNDIKTLIEDHKGNIWIGTWANGLSRFDPGKDQFYPYPRINQKNSAQVIFQDNKNTIWVGSWGLGLFRLVNPYDLNKVKYINYPHIDGNENSISDNIIYSISQDENLNHLWVGTRTGLSILNKMDDPFSFSNYIPNQSNNTIPGSEITSIVRDKAGIMWIGTLGGGVSAVNTRKSMLNMERLESVQQKLSSNSVRAIMIRDNGEMWLGLGSYGLVIANGNKYTYYKDQPDFKSIQEISALNEIVQTKDKSQIWLASCVAGLYIYTPKANGDKVKNLKITNTPWLQDNIIQCLKEDSRNIMWIGMHGGLSIYDLKVGKGYIFPYLFKRNGKLNTDIITTIEEDGDGSMWVGTESGIYHLNGDFPRSRKFAVRSYNLNNEKIKSDKVQYLFRDKRGNLWAGTDGGGLNVYNREKDIFVSVHQKYNLPGDIVFNMVDDQYGNLWLATNTGLVRLKISPENNNDYNTRSYTSSDGLQDNTFNRYAIFKSRDGELFFGGHKGYVHFYPKKVEDKVRFTTPVVVTDIRIFNKSLDGLDAHMRKRISKESAEFTKRIRLSYKDNNFSIEFAALSFANTKQNKYAYKLDGFDKDWQYTDASRRFAYYNNLKSGTYHFYLKATNEDGIWNQRSSVLEVEVLSPPWATWWAFLIYFCILTTIAYFIFSTMQNRIRLTHSLKLKDLEQAKTEELNQVKLQFFTNITHEFLTPLTILSATLDELKIITPQNKQFHQVMSTNISKLMRLLHQILEFRKSETGNLKLKVSKGDIAVFVRDEVESFRPIMKNKKIHFSLICDPENIPAYFDPDKLDKIIYNLFSNASKYNRPGGYVQVSVALTEDEKRVLISVKDNGEGISAKGLQTLFQRFYEGEYRRYNTTGTGIGLSLAKDLVKLHGGEIKAESIVGKGTTFIVEIPMTRDAFQDDQIEDYGNISEDPVQDLVQEVVIPSEQKKKDFSLLLIEDNEDLLLLMVKLLSREYNVFTAKNGKEGARIINEQEINLVVSDIMMPEMDGNEFCKYVKNNLEISHIPIILLTAKESEADKVESYESGADSYINKPFNLAVLKANIKSLIRSREKLAHSFSKQFAPEVKNLNYTSVDEKFLQKAIDCVYSHLDDFNFDQQVFTEEMGSSKSTLYKKLKSLTGLNTSAFISNIRLKAACKIIQEKKRLRISELAYAVGFNDPKYFSSCFKKQFGLNPTEYLDKFLQSEGSVESSVENV